MPIDHDLKDKVRKYLLGELSEADSQALEERYFADAWFLQAMEEIEQDLINDYAGRRLAPAEQQRFADRYLSVPELRAKVEAATRQPVRGLASGWQVALAAVVLCAAIVGAWRLARPAATPAVAMLRLAPGIMQATVAPVEWVVRPVTREVDLVLEGADRRENLRLRVSLPDEQGQLLLLWESSFLKASAAGAGRVAYAVRLPRTAVRRGDHLLQLLDGTSGEVHETYALRVVEAP